MQRRLARILAFQTLFELEARARAMEDVVEDRVRDLADEDRAVDQATRAWALELARGTARHRDEIDRHIAAVAPAFPVHQLPVTDRVDLELAVYQIAYDHSVPIGAVINEAVEIAKTYGGESSGRFVNGVLGTIAKGLRGREQDPHDPQHPRRRER